MAALEVILLLVCVLLGGALIWLLLDRGRLLRTAAVGAEREAGARAHAEREVAAGLVAAAELESLRRAASDLGVDRATLVARLRSLREENETREGEIKARLDEYKKLFAETIEAHAARALKDAAGHLKETFSQEQKLAGAALDARVKPISDTLRKTEEKLGQIEKDRLASYASLSRELENVVRLNSELKHETGSLVAALRKPQVRGRYGEVQLERVAELAGMRSWCDFSCQESARDEDGVLKRPDMVVKLPNGRCVAVDAKTNIEAYLDAIEASDPAVAERHLDRFATHVSDQARALAKKEYWSQFDGAAEFVVMFIPGDQFIDAALQRRADLLDVAAQHGVILASPSTLIGLLRAVYVGWRESKLTDRAEELFKLGKELHERVEKVLRDMDKVGNALRTAGKAYGDVVSSVDSRLMVTLRKFEDAGAKSERTLPELSAVETDIRSFRSLPAEATVEAEL